jgi:hypothetical protein
VSARYRIQQGVRALLAFSQPVDTALAATHLTPSLLRCFTLMRRADQLHSLNVLRSVLAQEPVTPPELAAAALLHDVGKSRYPYPTWQKTLVVLVRAFLPRVFRRLSSGDAHNFWQRPFVVNVHHPAWSAEIITQAGADPLTVWLVAHHAESAAQHAHHPDVYLLKRLKRADDAN